MEPVKKDEKKEKKKGWLSRLFEGWDQKMKAAANQKKCCGGDDKSGKSSCC